MIPYWGHEAASALVLPFTEGTPALGVPLL